MNSLVPLPSGGPRAFRLGNPARWGLVVAAAAALLAAWAWYPWGAADSKPAEASPAPSAWEPPHTGQAHPHHGEVSEPPAPGGWPAPNVPPAPKQPRAAPGSGAPAGAVHAGPPPGPRDMPHDRSPPPSPPPAQAAPVPPHPAPQGLPPPRPQAQVYSSRPDPVRGAQTWGVCAACGVVSSVRQLQVPAPGLEAAAGAAIGAAAGAQLGAQVGGGALGAAAGAAAGAQLGVQAGAQLTPPQGPVFEHRVRLESGADVVLQLPQPVPEGTRVMIERGQLVPLRTLPPTPAQGGQTYSSRP